MRIYKYLKHFNKKRFYVVESLYIHQIDSIYSGRKHFWKMKLQWSGGFEQCSQSLEVVELWAQGESSHRSISLTECKIMGVWCEIRRNRFHARGLFIQGHNFAGSSAFFWETELCSQRPDYMDLSQKWLHSIGGPMQNENVGPLVQNV